MNIPFYCHFGKHSLGGDCSLGLVNPIITIRQGKKRKNITVLSSSSYRIYFQPFSSVQAVCAVLCYLCENYYYMVTVVTSWKSVHHT